MHVKLIMRQSDHCKNSNSEEMHLHMSEGGKHIPRIPRRIAQKLAGGAMTTNYSVSCAALSLWTRRRRLLVCIFVYRLVLALTLRTAESPDEWWQSTEVAYNMVYGKGLLPWEWHVGIRSVTFPLLFAFPMYALKIAKLDTAFLIWLCGRLVQAAIATGIDYCTLIFTTLLDQQIANEHDGAAEMACKSGKAKDDLGTNTNEEDRGYQLIGRQKSASHHATPLRLLSPSVTDTAVWLTLFNWYGAYAGSRCYSNVLETLLVFLATMQSNLTLFLVMSAVSCMVRVTSALALLPAFAVHLHRYIQQFGIAEGALRCFLLSLSAAIATLVMLAVIDYSFYHRWLVTPLRFLHYNIVLNVSHLYGTHPFHWYLLPALPVIIGPHIIFLLGLPHAIRAEGKHSSGRKNVVFLMSLFAWIVFCHSTVAHKEMRFIYPVLPYCNILISYVISALVRQESRIAKITHKATWKLRCVSLLHVVFLVVNVSIIIFTCFCYRRGGVGVMSAIRNDQATYGHIDIMAPCYFTPGLSYVHNKVEELYLINCPPYLDPSTGHRRLTEDDLFRENPTLYTLWRYDRVNLTSRVSFANVDPSWLKLAQTFMPKNSKTSPLPDGMILFDYVADELTDIFLIPYGYRRKYRVFHTPLNLTEEDWCTYVEFWVRV